MAKQKTKRSTFDTLCTEVESGVWEWETKRGSKFMKWRYQDQVGLNTARIQPDGTFLPFAFFKKLDIAVSYSLGYLDGFTDGEERAP